MHPDMLIGRISLKRLEGRKVIYKYWKEVHDDFNNYIEIQDFGNDSIFKILNLYQFFSRLTKT